MCTCFTTLETSFYCFLCCSFSACIIVSILLYSLILFGYLRFTVSWIRISHSECCSISNFFHGVPNENENAICKCSHTVTGQHLKIMSSNDLSTAPKALYVWLPFLQCNRIQLLLSVYRLFSLLFILVLSSHIERFFVVFSPSLSCLRFLFLLLWLLSLSAQRFIHAVLSPSPFHTLSLYPSQSFTTTKRESTILPKLNRQLLLQAIYEYWVRFGSKLECFFLPLSLSHSQCCLHFMTLLYTFVRLCTIANPRAFHLFFSSHDG